MNISVNYQPVVSEATFTKKYVQCVFTIYKLCIFLNLLNGLMSLLWSLERLTTCYKRTVNVLFL